MTSLYDQARYPEHRELQKVSHASAESTFDVPHCTVPLAAVLLNDLADDVLATVIIKVKVFPRIHQSTYRSTASHYVLSPS